MRADRRAAPRDAHCALLWARLAADRGDVELFRSRLGDALICAASSIRPGGLARAIALAERLGPGEHQLCVADLAREVGNEELADRLESGLLEERCLPAVRIAPLLHRLQQQGRASKADIRRRARDAARYCREPRVIALAGGRSAVATP